MNRVTKMEIKDKKKEMKKEKKRDLIHLKNKTSPIMDGAMRQFVGNILFFIFLVT